MWPRFIVGLTVAAMFTANVGLLFGKSKSPPKPATHGSSKTGLGKRPNPGSMPPSALNSRSPATQSTIGNAPATKPLSRQNQTVVRSIPIKVFSDPCLRSVASAGIKCGRAIWKGRSCLQSGISDLRACEGAAKALVGCGKGVFSTFKNCASSKKDTRVLTTIGSRPESFHPWPTPGLKMWPPGAPACKTDSRDPFMCETKTASAQQGRSGPAAPLPRGVLNILDQGK